jgi:plasmid maintenance system antidote protein VapI
MRHFFVTGLPRCRSAWFANLLTYGDSFCFHDAWHGLDSVEAIRPKLESVDNCPQSVGISDPALLLFWREMSEWYPDAKWVVVKRDYLDTVRSCTKITTPNRRASLGPMAEELDALTEAMSPLVIDFTDITAETISELENYLDVDCGPKERIEMLLKFNVQIDVELLRESLAALLRNPPSFLKAA